jgi:hypothetical protein
VDVRIVYDHRVLDGATVARALARLEDVLNGEIAAELSGSAARATWGRMITEATGAPGRTA